MLTTQTPKPIQKRTLKTRSALIEAARALCAEAGYAALKIEDIVARAGVAKGTFFAHFRDKDALLERLIGDDLDGLLDGMEGLAPPRTVDDVLDAVVPYFGYMAADRQRFDVILRYSGAAGVETIGPVASTFGRSDAMLKAWLADAPFRKDIGPDLLAEGIGAFGIQAVALNFCAINMNIMTLRERLATYLTAWLLPGVERDAPSTAHG